MIRLIFILLCGTVFMASDFALELYAQAQENYTVVEALGGSKEFANPYGVSLSAGMGHSVVNLKPHNQGDAIYTGINLAGSLSIPLYEVSAYSARLGLTGRYLDLTNNANSSTQREGGNHVGLGAGLRFNIYRLVFGADIYAVKARQYWVGDVNDYREFNFAQNNWFAGLDFSVSKVFRFSLLYSQATANIAAKDLAHDGPAKYKDATFWLTFSYGTGHSFVEFLGSLFDSSK